MKKILKFGTILLTLLLIFSNSVLAEGNVLEVPIQVEVNGGTIEINGRTNLPEITQIQDKGEFILSFANPQAGDEYLYLVYQTDKTDTNIIYDDTVYEVRVHFILVNEDEVKAEVTVNEVASDTKSAEIVFTNTVKPKPKGTITVIYKTEDGIILKEYDSEDEVGNPYSTDKLTFDGYEFSRMADDSAEVVGEYIDGHLVITYIYKKPKPPVIPVPEPIRQLISTGGGNGAFLALGMLVSSILSLFAINKKKKGNR